MCIIFAAVQQHPDYPLIIAANRDEFYARPTAPSSFWHTHPDMLAGKDLSGGGTWMGVTRNGHIAALTNIRNPGAHSESKKTRGELVVDYLTDQPLTGRHLESLKINADQYNGFNFLFGHYRHLAVFNSESKQHAFLGPGVHGLSNASLNTPWPKALRGTEALQQYIQDTRILDVDRLFTLLRDPTQAQDNQLPDTGVSFEWEKALSSIFIRTPEYGTRSSTVLLVDKAQNVNWYECHYSVEGIPGQMQHFSWKSA